MKTTRPGACCAAQAANLWAKVPSRVGTTHVALNQYDIDIESLQFARNGKSYLSPSNQHGAVCRTLSRFTKQAFHSVHAFPPPNNKYLVTGLH